MQLSQLTVLQLCINVLIDKDEKLELDKTIKLIEEKKIGIYLKNGYSDIDLSLYKPKDLIDVSEIIYNEFEGYGSKARVRKKLGITKDGLILLSSLITSYIQNKFSDEEIDPINPYD